MRKYGGIPIGLHVTTYNSFKKETIELFNKIDVL